MLRGLEGRRVAVVSSSEAQGPLTPQVVEALERAGATVQHLASPGATDEDFHGAKYAGLIVLGDSGARFGGDSRVIQLVREFLASDKPVAALGSAVAAILEAGGASGRSVASHPPLQAALDGAGAKRVEDGICVDDGLITARGDVSGSDFAARVVEELSEQLDERAVDETSDLSFPASDPPAVTATPAKAAPEQRP